MGKKKKKWDWQGHLNKADSGVKMRMSLEAMPLSVRVPTTARHAELAVQGEAVQMYATEILDRIMTLSSPEVSDVIAEYAYEVAQWAELNARLRSGWLSPLRAWERMDVENAMVMLEGFSVALSRARSQLQLVRERTAKRDLVDSDGRPLFWLVGLRKLMAKTRMIVLNWGRLLSWLAEHSPEHFEDDDLEAVVARVLEHTHG